MRRTCGGLGRLHEAASPQVRVYVPGTAGRAIERANWLRSPEVFFLIAGFCKPLYTVIEDPF